MHLKTDKVGFKKSHRDKRIFFLSTHQVGMKNFVKCYKDFFGYFNLTSPTCSTLIVLILVIPLGIRNNSTGSSGTLNSTTPYDFEFHKVAL